MAKPDPSVRPDGRCGQCGRKRTISKQTRQYAGDAVDRDPFCSTACCRKWQGCELPRERMDRDYVDRAVA